MAVTQPSAIGSILRIKGTLALVDLGFPLIGPPLHHMIDAVVPTRAVQLDCYSTALIRVGSRLT